MWCYVTFMLCAWHCHVVYANMSVIVIVMVCVWHLDRCKACVFMQGGQRTTDRHCPTKTLSARGRMESDQLRVPATNFHLHFIFWIWDVANPRTALPFRLPFQLCCTLFVGFNFRRISTVGWWKLSIFGWRNSRLVNFSWRWGWLLQLRLWRLFGMKGEGSASILKSLPPWSRYNGVVLHVRCIPHHNSIRQVRASACLCAHVHYYIHSYTHAFIHV